MNGRNIKAKIKSIESKNKNFSFDKTMKLFDATNCIFIDIIKCFDFKLISEYKNSKYLFKEIPLELEEVNRLLHESKTLMAVALLRNTYEEIMYIIATSCLDNLEINLKTTAGYFIGKVKKNCEEIFGEDVNPSFFTDIYHYFSQLTHITDLKESASYLQSRKNTTKYLTNEIKYYFLLINYVYIVFIYGKINAGYSLCENLFELAKYNETINSVYFFASTISDKKLYLYFDLENDEKDIKKKKELLAEKFDDIRDMNSNAGRRYAELGPIIDQQLKDSGYNEMFMKELNS